jgi:hypothetical protein
MAAGKRTTRKADTDSREHEVAAKDTKARGGRKAKAVVPAVAEMGGPLATTASAKEPTKRRGRQKAENGIFLLSEDQPYNAKVNPPPPKK